MLSYGTSVCLSPFALSDAGLYYCYCSLDGASAGGSYSWSKISSATATANPKIASMILSISGRPPFSLICDGLDYHKVLPVDMYHCYNMQMKMLIFTYI